MDYMLYAGTVGQGVWRSEDGGGTFARASNGMFMEAEVRALAAHPDDPKTLYAGTDAGVYRTTNGGNSWDRLNTPFDAGAGWQSGVVVWSLLISPHKPETLLVGVCPPALYRSEDGGATWKNLDAPFTRECPPIRYSRVTCLLTDPADPNTLWAGVEIDGIWRSADNGSSWEQLGEGLSSQDIHALALVPGSPRRLFACTNNDLNLSTDEGRTWQPQNVKEKFPHGYCRGLQAKADDPRTLFLGNGNGPPGTTGSLQVSKDGGETWRQAALPVPPNSTLWTFGVSAAFPALVFAAAINGYLYRSEDGGETWTKCRHEFGEIRALAITTRD